MRLLFSTLSAGIESMECRKRRAVSLIQWKKVRETNTRSRSEMPVCTVGDHPQRSQPDDVHGERGAVFVDGRTETFRTSDDRQNRGTRPMPTFATRPLSTSSTILVTEELSWTDSKFRRCNSTTSFVLNHVFFWFGKNIDFSILHPKFP